MACSVPDACKKARPSPWSFCRMKPSPPKKPAPILRVNATEISMPRAAQRKLSFCASTVPPQSRKLSGTILPGNGAANATSARRAPLLPNNVTKNESPESTRFPAPTSLSNKPPPFEFGSRVVAMVIPSRMNIMPPASAKTASPGSSVMMTACRSSPMI